MAVLAAGAVGAAMATAWMGSNGPAGIALALVAFTFIGIGVGASGTSLLVLLAKRVDARRRAAAATIVWLMMIAGFAVTAGLAGHFLDPFSPARLVTVTAVVSAAAFLLTLVAVRNIEGPAAAPLARAAEDKPPFRVALAQVWGEPRARRFAIFVFVSMLAYSAQDLVLEPFAGTVFGYTPGESTTLSGIQHGGVFAGMLLVALLASVLRPGRAGALHAWAIGGCIASAVTLFGLAAAGGIGPSWPLRTSVFVLGVANGAFAVAAIGSMMSLVSDGRQRREGVRMGLWGAAQAVAFGLGGFLGTLVVDLTRYLADSPVTAYAMVFAAEGVLFLVAACLAYRIDAATRARDAGRAFGAHVGYPDPRSHA
jgi:BCD family chlorophyll transporter-like MFS transporter